MEERLGKFETEILGIFVSFRQAYSWSIGNVYRLSGSPSKAIYSLTGADLSIDTHVARALEHAGLSRVIPREQFSELRRTMEPQRSSC
jgi:hypothetical protein